MMKPVVFGALSIALGLAGGCAMGAGPAVGAMAPAAGSAMHRQVGHLSLIGEQRIPFKYDFQGTVVGGLSGLDYSAKSDTWIVESDDRSEASPARFYTVRLAYDAHAFSSVDFTGVHFFKQADGSNYPGTAGYLLHGGEVADIESIRFDPLDDSVWYSSEGSRTVGLSPFVKHADKEGSHPVSLSLPAMFKATPLSAKGPRDNLSFEGLTFAADGKSLWVSMEAPLYQDGPVPTPASGGVSRITRYGRDGVVLGQYAYSIDPIPAAPGQGKAADNGVSEMLAVDDHTFLILERSGVQDSGNRYKNYIRLYEIDVEGATDIRSLASLRDASYVPVSKRLVLDLNTLGLDRLDNVEGMAWGPKLSNGHDSLVLVSDDNFNASQVTQFLAFDVTPK